MMRANGAGLEPPLATPLPSACAPRGSAARASGNEHAAAAAAAAVGGAPPPPSSLKQMGERLCRRLDGWTERYEHASRAIERLLALVEDESGIAGGGGGGRGNGVAAVGSTAARRKAQERQLLQLVAERLGAASTQVQHTREQAVAITQMHERLAAVERSRREHKADGRGAHERERRAIIERELLAEERPTRRERRPPSARRRRLQG